MSNAVTLFKPITLHASNLHQFAETNKNKPNVCYIGISPIMLKPIVVFTKASQLIKFLAYLFTLDVLTPNSYEFFEVPLGKEGAFEDYTALNVWVNEQNVKYASLMQDIRNFPRKHLATDVSKNVLNLAREVREQHLN